MAARNALHDAVETEAAQIVGHSAERVVGWIEAQQLRDQCAHFQIRESSELEAEYAHRQQSLDAGITKAQGRCPLSVDFDRANYLVEGILANRTIVGNFLDV